MIAGITRVRNEGLILEDTLAHFFKYCDQIFVYDDCSTDNTVEIARSFDNVKVIDGDEWRRDRIAENTRHRAIVLLEARKAKADWALCFDADERFVGELPDFRFDAYTCRLFDGYMTADSEAYAGGELAQLPRLFGPEFRDIVMLFRPHCAKFNRPGLRAPIITGSTHRSNIFVKHYGKCLSVEHWEETCRYYSKYFPPRFSVKWKGRFGKAIHQQSDFGRPLYEWERLVQGEAEIFKIK